MVFRLVSDVSGRRVGLYAGFCGYDRADLGSMREQVL